MPAARGPNSFVQSIWLFHGPYELVLLEQSVLVRLSAALRETISTITRRQGGLFWRLEVAPSPYAHDFTSGCPVPDFKRLLSEQSNTRSANPRDIFNRLVKPAYMRDLLPGQVEVLDGWWHQRSERDNIIKQNTGGGKTLVGTLIAESTKIELGGSVLYLCPNKQLVDQTIKNAAEVGIVAEEFVAGAGVKLPPRFMSGEAMLVASYAALFNGRSKFGAQGGTSYINLSALILDDAHVELSA